MTKLRQTVPVRSSTASAYFTQVLLCVTVAVLLAGCFGYALEGRGLFLPKHIRRVAVPLFANETTKRDLEIVLTDAVNEEISRRGGVKLVRESEADAVLQGTIIRYDRQHIAPDASGMVRYPRTHRAGLYTVQLPDRPAEVFAVNLLDEAESNIEPRDELVFSGQPVKARARAAGRANQELWPLLACVALAVVCLEWFVYNSKLRL